MRLVTFEHPDSDERLGALIQTDEQVLDLQAAWRRREGSSNRAFSSLQSLIETGERALEHARALERAAPAEDCLPREAVRLLSPLPRPEQLRDFVCFEEHLLRSYEAALRTHAALADDPAAKEMELRASGRYRVPEVWYRQPIYYKGNRFAVVGTDADVEWPHYSRLIDYELELAAVIGRKAKNVAVGEARACIFGYMVFNDLTARDAQITEMAGNLGPAKGKDFDGANVLGPCLVTADELGDPYSLTMIARINGVEWSRGNSGSMYWRFEDLIAHVSRCETLHPGEILASGTVGGGCGIEQGRFLSPGDVIELEIGGIGILRNQIFQER